MMPLTKEDIFDEVLGALGDDGVDVELSDKDLERCLKDAMRRYSRANPLRDRESLSIPANGLKSVDLHPETYAVTEVEFQDQLQVLETRDSLNFNIFNGWQIIGAGYGAGGLGNTADYAYLVEWRNLTKREFSLEPDWYFEPDVQYDEADDSTPLPRKLYFFNPTGLSMNVMYVAHRPRRLEEVLPNDHDWMVDWCKAHAKEIVGRKRNKFKTAPAAGQALQLDGADLLEEAREEKATLLETLSSRFAGMPTFQWG